MKINKIYKKIMGFAASFTLMTGLVVSNSFGSVAAMAEKYVAPEATFGNYFTADYNTKTEAMNAADDLNEEICEEGFTMLKNADSALPLAEHAKVSVFGKNSSELFYGLISNYVHLRIPDDETEITFAEALTEAGMKVNPTLVNFYNDNSKSGAGRGSMPTNGTYVRGLKTGETPVSKYTSDIEESYADYSDAAIVVISRSGGEGWDPPTTMKKDAAGNPVDGARDAYDHYLQLDQNEADLMKYVGEHFEKVIVVLNTPGQFECGFLDDPGHYAYHENIKGAIWVGYSGKTGIKAIGKILNGKVNPSGKTVDTWARDFKLEPTFNNFSTFHDNSQKNSYANGAGNYVIYKEGIYVGYRYYETRGYTEGTGAYTTDGTDAKPHINGTETTQWDNWYQSNVVYPFGYGLSYTTFSQEIVSASKDNNSTITATDSITVQVKVTNTGSVAGKETAQLFLTAPYTNGGIEKAHVVYAAYAKTKLLEPGESQTVSMTVDVNDFASYDYSDANGNGFKGYELEAGAYELKLMSDAHNVIDTLNYTVGTTEKLSTDAETGNEVVNQFDDVSNYLTDTVGEQYMSRADFVGTFPKASVGLTASEELKADINRWSWSAKPSQDWIDEQGYVDDVEDFPITNESGEVVFGNDTGDIQLKDLYKADYDDPLWDEFMAQLSANTLKHLVADGGYRSGWDVKNLGITRVINAGQPAGYMTLFSGMEKPVDGNYAFFCSDTVTASSHNEELAYKKGIAIGNEALFGEGEDSNDQYSRFPGWYAPACDTHRSPFGGRNADYYSEDGMISGKMASQIIKGAMEKGVFCFLKHFAVNDQEYTRVGLCTWLNEQALREIYLKPFELAVKEGGTTAIMSALNRIGTTWTGGSYELLTNILRKEWGFHGMVVTDSYIGSYSYVDQMVYAGGDISLGYAMGEFNRTETKLTTVNGWKAIYRSAKNILYTMANSMAINTGYATPPSTLNDFTESGIITPGAVNSEYKLDIGTVTFNEDAFTMQGFEVPDESEIVYSLKEGYELPDGLTLSADGVISGVPTAEATNHEFIVQATYSSNGITSTVEATFNITIASSNGAIIYEANEAIGDLVLDKECSVSLAGATIFKPGSEGEDLGTITYSVSHKTPLPEGLTLSADGTLSGTPTKSCDGYTIIVEAKALGFKTVEKKFVLSVVNDSLTYSATELAAAKVTKSYYASVATAQGGEGITYALKDGSTLPAGLTLTASGSIVGTPSTVVTNHTFVVVAKAPYLVAKEAQFSISVGISYENVELVDATCGVVYNTSVNMANGAADTVYSVKAGDTLPEGLTLSADGTLSGTPTKAGVYTFTICANAENTIGDEVSVRLYVANGVADENGSVLNGIVAGATGALTSVAENLGVSLNAVAAGIAVVIVLAISVFVFMAKGGKKSKKAKKEKKEKKNKNKNK